MAFPLQLIKRAQVAQWQSQISQLEQVVGQATEFIAQIERGNLDAAPLSGHPLTEALTHMQARLRYLAAEEQARTWATEGLAKFANLLREHQQDLAGLADTVISQLVKYLQANQGAIFILETGGEDGQYLRMQACYAYNRKKYLNKQIGLREGLAGQCVLEGETIFITQVPTDYLTIESGLGDARPASVLIVPLKTNETIVGVVELASFQVFAPHQVAFTERLAETVAAMVQAARNAQQTLHLLQESQNQGHELRQREEEMRQNMEELQATQEAMRRAQEDVGKSQEMLENLINATNDSIMLISPELKIMYVNNVVKQRYLNSAYAGLDKGADVLEFLGRGGAAVRQEWEAYYRRCLAGEGFDFVAKSTVGAENTYRHYFLHPIVTDGQVAGLAVVSRDVSQQKQDEERIRQLLDDAQRYGAELARNQINLTGITNLSQESMLMLDRQYCVIFMNDVLRKRYQGTGYAQMDVGSSVLEVMEKASLPAVREEWKGYYDRAFRGEYFNFVSESVVNGEQATYRYYYIGPVVLDENIVGAAVFSRDMTPQRRAEMELERAQQQLAEQAALIAQQQLELDTLRRAHPVSANGATNGQSGNH
ncbi:MAG: GAF domain-containing protein [Bernardetiaceae bacterium]|jgi:methyl-accepting chemotaxis protein|nr:GAF domain-containing protein [Bernardetiaceae bacterium]